MMIVGNISGKEEAKEIEIIAKSFIMARRARACAKQARMTL